MREKVLLINDLPGYGKVALSAMMPIMSKMGYDIYNLPTALVSNTLDYGKFDILETTQYMKNTIQVWDELGFSFDAVSVGFIVSEEQVKVISDFCRGQKEKDTKIFVDPIMGDEGKLYNGVGAETIANMRELCAVADLIVPNVTEAAFLADCFIDKKSLTYEEGKILIDRLRKLGAKSVVISSILLDDKHSVIGYDCQNEEYFLHTFDYIPVRFPGTGDTFSAFLIGKVLQGESLSQATKYAMDGVRNLIVLNIDNQDKYNGLQIERYLEEIGL